MKKTKSTPEPGPLQVLILEDNPADAELIEQQLRRAKIDFTACLVEGKKAFIKALADFRPQVILSDFKLPAFDGLAALEAARAQAPDVPFIFVSGSIGEEMAIETLALGASDYIFKDNLARLGPAVKRVVEEALLKSEKRRNDEELSRHVAELRLLSEAADHFVHLNDLDNLYKYLADTIRKISGADYLLLSLYDEQLQAMRPNFVVGIESFRATLRRRFGIDPMNMVFYLKDMRPEDFSDLVSRRLLPVRDGLYGLSNRMMSRSLSRIIERLLGICSMHSMGFSWENQLFGGLTVFFKKDNELKNSAQIEALVNLAAVAIKRLLAEKSLRASEERFRRISETMSDISYSCQFDKTGTYSLSWMTGATERITGYTIEEIMAMKCWGKLVLEEDFPDFEKYVTGVTQGNGGICELRLRHKDGSLVWVQSFVQAMAYPDDPGRPVLYGGLTDISKRKQAETALRESESKYRTLVTQSPDGIFVVDLKGKFLSVNQAMCAGLKYSEEKLLSMTIWDIVPEQYLDLHKKRLADILKGKAMNEAAEYLVKGKDGETHYIAILSTPYYKEDQLIGFQGIARDVTEKKKMEILLRESEEYYRTLVETSPDAIIIVDAGGRVTFSSNKTLELFGIPAQTSIKGTSILDFVEPGEIPRVQARLVEILSGRSLPQLNEYRLLRQDGRPFWADISSAPLRDAAGRSIGLLLVCRDVSERKQTETILHIQYKIANAVASAETFFGFFETVRKELGALFDTTNFLVALYDEASGMLSAPFEKDEKDAIPEWPAEKSLTGLVLKQKRSVLLRGKEIQQLDEAGATEQIGSNAEAWLGVPLLIGEKVLGAIVVQSYENADAYDQSTVSIMEMIASQLSVYIERKQAEEQIRASLKEKEVLLQEIHHRVKNNLQIISGLLTLQADQSAGKSLDEIFSESQDRIRSIALIHEKLYRSHNLAEIAFDEYLRALVEGLFLSHGVAAGRIAAKFEMESIFFTIEKAIPLGLIVNELVTNALKHAFPAGRQGEIRIGLHGYQDAKPHILKTDSGTLHIVPTCELTVADDGVGLPDGKAPEQEKTLGMKLVAMLAKQLHAELKIKTGPGTEFHFLLPALPASNSVKDKDHGG